MYFDKFFNIVSYGVVICSFFALAISGGIGSTLTLLFVTVLILAWRLENSRWQIPEKLGTVFTISAIPLLYLYWKYIAVEFPDKESGIVAMIVRVILLLVAVKLLQKKTERNWIFLYLLSFFEVLLAATLSISPLYLGCLVLYLLVSICAIVTFEIKKTSRTVSKKSNNKNAEARNNFDKVSVTQLCFVGVVLLGLTFAVGTPLFFSLPRVGGSSFGSRSGKSYNLTGFSDSVRLGELGQLLQSDQIVLRARLEKSVGKNVQALRWRGVALDSFDNKGWHKSKPEYMSPFTKGERDFFLIDYASDQEDLIIQTVYLEPMNTFTLFNISRPVAVEGDFEIIKKDLEGGLTFQKRNFADENLGELTNSYRSDSDRLSYKVYSDTNLPSIEELKSENKIYSEENQKYLQIPAQMDKRIGDLAARITDQSSNRYDKSKAVENYLQTQLNYSLEMRAAGEQPLADFLFNVRAGHCEYFASAMAMMLRTQGISARIVNGFQQGDYNETADVFVVKQKDAHSWVEVYFPEKDVWFPFDPTPLAERNPEMNAATGVLKKFNSYLEAFETFWIQYFVSYDNQEQRSLARAFKSNLIEYQKTSSAFFDNFQRRLSDWWKQMRGDDGLQASINALGLGAVYLFLAMMGLIFIIWAYRKFKKFNIWSAIYGRAKYDKQAEAVEFYQRMQKILESQGFTRTEYQTPLEFALTLEMPEVIKITEIYNKVRFGRKTISSVETIEIEFWLKTLIAKL